MLSESNIAKIVFGGIYTANPIDLFGEEHINDSNPWDQRYKYWIPVCVPQKNGTKEYYMINCYQIDWIYGHTRSEELENIIGRFAIEYKEDGSNALHKTYNYYYRSGTKLTDYNLYLFKLVANLHDYEYISDREAENYDPADLLENVMLYREHAYPNGITLVKKGARKSMTRQIDAMIADAMHWASEPRVSNADIKRLKEMILSAEENHQPFNVQKARAAVTYLEGLAELQNKFEPISEWYRKMCYMSDSE